MKLLRFKKDMNSKKGYKSLTMSQKLEDKDSATIVRKNFVYHLSISDKPEVKPKAPEIFIKKAFDTKRQTEKFSFEVKGYFFMRHKRVLLRVDFHHMLNIKITWKSKNFSPNKSEILTK